MKRREFIALFGGAAAWPFAVHAQQPKWPVIGFLSGVSPGPFAQRLAAFRQGLNETGTIEGRFEVRALRAIRRTMSLRSPRTPHSRKAARTGSMR